MVWLPEANSELQEARTWYDSIRPELGERFAQEIEATVEESLNIHCSFPSYIEGGDAAVSGGFHTESSSRFKSTGF